MNKITGNEPANPIIYHDGVYQVIQSGLTIRQHFAAMAMQGMVANPALMEAITSSQVIKGGAAERIAEVSVEYANALIAELNKTQPK